MKKVKVSNKWAQVDDDEYELISQYNWWLLKTGYAYTQVSSGGARTTILMHRLIMEAKKGQEIDHINLDKLDNRKVNLRFCTRSQNNMNTLPRAGYKGVRWTKNAWQAEIKHNRKYIYLGRFKTAEEAANRYDEKARELFGAFAHPNIASV